MKTRKHTDAIDASPYVMEEDDPMQQHRKPHARTPTVKQLADYLRANEDEVTECFECSIHDLDAPLTLIAAAPEMLGLLQDVQSWLETNLKQGNINAGTANRDGDLVSQLRHTITRATGRERG